MVQSCEHSDADVLRNHGKQTIVLRVVHNDLKQLELVDLSIQLYRFGALKKSNTRSNNKHQSAALFIENIPQHFSTKKRQCKEPIWVFPKIGVPQNGWFMMENPVKVDDLGGGTIIFENTRISYSHPETTAMFCTNQPSPSRHDSFVVVVGL